MELHELISETEARIEQDKPYFKAVLAALKRLQKQTEKAQKRAGQPSDPEYQKFIGLYFEFHTSLVGVKPMLNPQQGQAMKQIIAYLADNVKSEEYTALDAWGWILKHWSRLSPFLQNQVTLHRIRLNLPEILMQLRNGATTQQKTRAGTSSIKAGIIKRRAGTNDQGNQQS